LWLGTAEVRRARRPGARQEPQGRPAFALSFQLRRAILPAMPRARGGALSARLALASLGTAAAIGVVCAVGLSSLQHASTVGAQAAPGQLAIIDDAAAMSAFQYQKGFVAEYLLTGDRGWLAELETSRPAFERWLAQTHTKIGPTPAGAVLDDIQREYSAYD